MPIIKQMTNSSEYNPSNISVSMYDPDHTGMGLSSLNPLAKATTDCQKVQAQPVTLMFN